MDETPNHPLLSSQSDNFDYSAPNAMIMEGFTAQNEVQVIV